jgi:hypothetical protein
MKIKRYGLLVTLAGIALALTLFLSSRLSSPAAPPPGTEVGVPPGGQNALEFIGRADQDGVHFVSYGYLTRINGLAQSLLYSTTNPLSTTEATARFTYYATSTLTSRNVISGVFVIDSAGMEVIYLKETPGAAFNNPASFASGTPIFTATVHYQDILNVQAPNQGIANGFGEVTQTGIAPFTLGTQTYHLGREGLMLRATTIGEGTRTDPITPKSFVVLSGNAVVTGLPGQQLFAPIVIRDAP